MIIVVSVLHKITNRSLFLNREYFLGIVHLEALEMLSKQASIKLQTLLTPLSGKALEEMEVTLTEVNELCELPEMDDDPENHSLKELEERLKAITEELTVTLEFDDIIA
jgi:hypothetical protein